MAKTFSSAERNILDLFKKETTFTFKGKTYTVKKSGKPTCSHGEPKTDIYIAAQDSIDRKITEFKISFKKENADFLENKINPERAEQLLGKHWDRIISRATSTLREKFLDKKLIYKEKQGKTEKGAITLGWKFELLNVNKGKLAGDLNLTTEQVIDVYAGTNLNDDKKNALINGELIPNSGVANFMLVGNDIIYTPQGAIDSLTPIEKYVEQHPKVYFACKALNYRTYEEKYDGDRPLAVYVNWSLQNGKLFSTIEFDTPLKQGGNIICHNLKRALFTLHVNTTDSLDEHNVNDITTIYQ